MIRGGDLTVREGAVNQEYGEILYYSMTKVHTVSIPI